MTTRPTPLTELPARYQAEALRACLAYTLEDASALGLVTTALHLKLAIMEIDDALKPGAEIKQAS
jgi:hypothetical protein